jgi:hypothetical protein
MFLQSFMTVCASSTESNASTDRTSSRTRASERLDERVLPGRARLDEAATAAAEPAPVPEGVRGHLGAVIHPDHSSFIDVASPSDAEFEALITTAAGGDETAVEATVALMSLRGVGDKYIGPAMFMDIARYLHERLIVGDATRDVLIAEAFYSYLLPQFEGATDEDGEDLFRRLRKLLSTREQREQARRTLNTVLGLELAPRRPANDTSAALDDLEIAEGGSSDDLDEDDDN